ncbi:Hpt domain-containing protein [Blastochloris viridis]|uniref:Hpt domain protein n=1 Tax=Blastochloris viridis TaxID=1079 RepID=A0A0H5BFV5_BLAVI|nr:Hpt domain-containing protein [Blastochloris viridis]ALK09051.1 Hpt domain protein [Blastochloris viridis]BAS01088.1 Hpt domain protein [Blastochloris viridis]CUU41713.1 Hpt domain protein [Blastochloris viridis]
MTNAKPDASVTPFHDHDVIVPKKNLKSFARKVSADENGLDFEAIERAEAALNELSSEFDGWMAIECDRLEASRKALSSGGLSKGSTQVMFRAAHDIKGEAATFGFPLAAEIADSLCRLIFHTPKPAALPLELIDRHVAAIRAVVRENMRGGGDTTAREVAEHLRSMAEAFLREQHKDDADWLADNTSPSIVPDPSLR